MWNENSVLRFALDTRLLPVWSTCVLLRVQSTTGPPEESWAPFRCWLSVWLCCCDFFAVPCCCSFDAALWEHQSRRLSFGATMSLAFLFVGCVHSKSAGQFFFWRSLVWEWGGGVFLISLRWTGNGVLKFVCDALCIQVLVALFSEQCHAFSLARDCGMSF